MMVRATAGYKIRTCVGCAVHGASARRLAGPGGSGYRRAIVPCGLRGGVGLRTVAFAAGAASSAGAVALLLALGLLAAVPARATTVLAMPFAEQCAGAETIVVATVRAVASRPSPRAPAFFETLVTVGVDEVVAGRASAELTLRLAGGEIGAVRQSIDGMPELQVGERYVVLLDRDRDPPSISPVMGFNQGLYRVERIAGADVVRDRSGRPLPADAAAALAAGGAAQRESGVGTAGAPSPSLDTFVAAIRAARP